MRLIFSLLAFVTYQSAFAIVDMKNANYSNTWVDLELPGSGYELKVSRTYNSKSIYSGMFGFGWCSDFETRIDITAEGNLKLTECGSGQEIFYTPREFSRKEIEKTANTIIARLKANKKFTDASLKKLSQDLLSDNDLRAKYASDLKIAIAIKEGSYFFANGKEVENVLYKDKSYIRNLPDGTSQRFNSTGKLTHLYDKNTNFIKFDYDKDLLTQITDNNGRRLSLKYYPSKKIRSIIGPNNLSAEYKFNTNPEDLTWVKNSWNNTYTYEYDELHNLKKSNYPDGTSIALKYDVNNDWVIGFTDRDKCQEDYSYEFDSADPKNHYWSTVKKTCGKEVVNESKHEFWYKSRADGEVYLLKVASTINGNVTEIAYHETFGKPTAIRRGGESYQFEYYANGQVKTKSGKFAKLTYEYDGATKKPSSVTTVAMNDKGKVVSTKKTQFKYDNRGNLVWAGNSDGQKINMTYDTKGRVASITDQAKKLVRIEYEEKFGRPAVVSRPGLGTIKVSYKQSGEIDKVTSAEGPTVAMQVASTFNNLLEIIQPATAEVYN